MKKILLNCYEYPPEIHGGVGSFTRDLAENLVKNGWIVYVIGIYYHNNSPNLKKKIIEEVNGVKVIRMRQSTFLFARLNIILDRLKIYREIKKLDKEIHFDLFESPESTGWFPLGSPIKPFVVRIHGAQIYFDNLLNRKGSTLWHFFETETIKKAGFLIAVSSFCGNKTLEICGINKKFKTIYNGIDTKKILNASVNSNYNTQMFGNYIVFANSVIKKKGVEELILAFNLLAERHPDYNLVIIGKSLGKINGVPYIEYLKTLINKQYSKRVFFIGWLDKHEDVFKLISDSKIAVYPSHMEGQGIAPTEAMILGKPVIYMKSGPGPEVIDHMVNGYLVDTLNTTDIANAMQVLIEDKELSETLGENAILKVKKDFDKDDWIKKNIELYNSILSHN